jgi:Uma2 family endonuclease
MNLAYKIQPRFTYADYSRWPEDERWELIHGDAYAMAAPLRIHQEIIMELAWRIRSYLEGKPCKIYVAPLDVRLPQGNENDDAVDTVVQPDIAVICDKSKLDAKGCRGAPDWIIEVLSPSTAIKDMDDKRRLYEAHGVREYWLIHPTERWGMIYLLNPQGKHDLPRMFALEQATAVAIFPDLSLDWAFLQETP